MAPAGISVHDVTVTSLVGPMLIGSWLNVWLLGAMLMQMRTYFHTARDDPRWIKGIVAFLLVCGVANSILDTFFTYDYVRQFGNTMAVQTSTWVFNTDPVMTVVMSYTVQTFFGWRVKRLTGQNLLAAFIFVSAFAQFLCGLGTSIGCGIVKEFVHFQRFKAIVIVWLLLAPITDFVIAGSLCWYLHTHRTGFAYTNDIMDKASRLTLQTGAITAVWASADLAIYLAFANNLHLILNEPLGLLYCNCLMSSLNARQHWNSSSYPQEEITKRRVGITVTTKSEVHRDQTELEVLEHHERIDRTSNICSSTPTWKPIPAEHMDDGVSSSSMEKELIRQNSAINSSEIGWKQTLGH